MAHEPIDGKALQETWMIMVISEFRVVMFLSYTPVIISVVTLLPLIDTGRHLDRLHQYLTIQYLNTTLLCSSRMSDDKYPYLRHFP